MKGTGTEFSFVAATRAKPRGNVLIVPLPAKPQPPLEHVTRVDRICDGAVSELIDVKAHRPESGRLAHTTRSSGYRRILLVSLGDAEQMSGLAIQAAASAAAQWLTTERIDSATLWIDGLVGHDGAMGHWAQGMVLAGFRFESYKETDPETPARIRIELRGTEQGVVTRTPADLRDALAIAAAMNYTRRLAHEPANILNPARFATEARALARNGKLKCTVLGCDRLKTLKMGGLLAVGGGAQHPPCLIQLEYRGAPGARAKTVLIGKGITFDTGGISIKPRAGMESMKFDMTGGATVLGIMKAVNDLKLKCNVIGLVAVAENAVSEKAYRPGDILRMMSGKTVEITNTDAEGRLVLADALWYAQKHLKPTALIDLATLTGGVGLALGTAAAGLMANDDTLAAELGEAGRRVQERLWRLPLWDEYQELLKSTEADLKNSGSKRDAHCIQGGMFLKAFVDEKVPWAHLDIASVAHPDDGKGANGRGASGFGVRLLIDFLRGHAG
jgi:leucyl aminopeptidase